MLVKCTDQTCLLFLISDSISERSETTFLSTCSNLRANFIGANVNSSRYLSRRQLKTISARYYSSSSSGNWPLEPIFRQKGIGDEGAFSPDLLARFCRKKERKRRDLARGRNAIDRTFGIQLFAEETTTINRLIIGDHWPNLASVDVIMHLTNRIFLGGDYFRDDWREIWWIVHRWNAWLTFLRGNSCFRPKIGKSGNWG